MNTRLKIWFSISSMFNVILSVVILLPAFWSHKSLDGVYKTKRGPSMSTPQGVVPGIQGSISINGRRVVIQTDYGVYKGTTLNGYIAAREGKMFLVKFDNVNSVIFTQYSLDSISDQGGAIYSLK